MHPLPRPLVLLSAASTATAAASFRSSYVVWCVQGKRPPWVWKMLDPRYDQCVGMCECLPGRDMPRTSLTVHFSCIRYVEKPSRYESERK